MTPNTVSNSGAVTMKQVTDAVEAYRAAMGTATTFERRFLGEYIRYCGRCGETLRMDRYSKKYPGKWQHAHNGGVWCKNDKQHGPKTRHSFPLPSLLVIEEMEL